MRITTAAGLLLLFAPPADAQVHLTPEGPATLVNVRGAAQTAEGRPPEVLVAVRVGVAEGGRADNVRLRVRSPQDPRGTQVGELIALPAAPGTYTFPAPHVRFDYRSGVVGIDQTSGGLALLRSGPCDLPAGPPAPENSPCQAVGVDLYAGDPPPGESGTPQRLDGRRLALIPVVERDLDQDLRGDVTEDRTDLTLRATAELAPDGSRLVRVVVENRGPVEASRPYIGDWFATAWPAGCTREPVEPYSGGPAPPVPAPRGFATEALPSGASLIRMFTVAPGPSGRMTIRVSSENPDLQPADDSVTVDLPATPEAPAAPPPPPSSLALVADDRQTLRSGVGVTVGSVDDRDVLVRVSVRRGRAVLAVTRRLRLSAGQPRNLRLRFTGRFLRILRRATPVRATITLRVAGGPAAESRRILLVG